MQDWLVMGIMFAGTPGRILARRWAAVAGGETPPRVGCPSPEAKPAPETGLVQATRPAATRAPAFLRLGRVDENADAERRAGRCKGFVRTGC